MREKLLDKIVFWGLCALTVLLPLPFGTVETGTILLFELAVALLVVLWILRFRGKGRTRGISRANGPGKEISDGEPMDLRSSWTEDLPLAPFLRRRAVRALLMILVGLFFLTSILQLIPLPDSGVQALSPKAAALHRGIAESGIEGAGGPGTWTTLSVAPALTLFEFLKYVAYGLYAFLVFKSLRTRKQVEIFVYALLAIGIFEAAYGIAEVFGGTERIFAYQKISSLGSATGTFINRNHLAGFLEMIFPLSLGILLAKADFFSLSGCRTLREKALWFSQERLQKCVIFGIVSSVLALGIIFSRSRSGIFILFITVFLMIIVLSASGTGATASIGGGIHGERAKKVLRTVLLAAVSAAMMIGIGPVIARFTKESWFLPRGRPAFYGDTIRMVRDFPLFGAGLGSYRYAFTPYQQAPTQGIVSHAHNDYLETLAESGVFGGGALVLSGLIGLGWLFIRWARRRDALARGVGLGALAGIMAVLLHGLTDFNLRIPANAAYFVMLYALAGRMITAYPSPDVAPVKNKDNKRFLWILPVVFFSFIAVRYTIGYRAYGAYQATRTEAKSIEGSFPALEKHLRAAVRLTRDPILTKELGRLYLERAFSENVFGTAEKRDYFCGRALESYSAALGRNPADAELYFELGKVFILYNFPLMIYRDKGLSLFKRAFELAPADAFLNLYIGYFFLTQWESLQEKDKQYALDRIRRMRDADKGFSARLRRLWKENFGGTKDLEALLKASGLVL